jgi:long-chain acyl-CoA synthetase
MSQASPEAGPVNPPEYWARAHPGRPAVIGDRRVMTYGEWDDLAGRLAESLAHLAAGHRRACVRSHLSCEWFVIRLALAKLGWEHVAVNWRLTGFEVAAILQDSQPDVFFFDDSVHQPMIAASEAAGALPVSMQDTQTTAVALAGMLERPDPPLRQSDPLSPFVTYSSGTTGRPKGVRKRVPEDREQLNQIRAYVAAERARRFGGPRRTLLTLPLHHGTGPRAARRCHDQGGTVYLLDPFDPRQALEIIDREKITDWKVVPTMLHRVRALGAEVLRSFDVSSIKSLSIGSAPTPWPLKLWALDYFGDVLFEAYGASELGIVATMPPAMHRQKRGSCGKVRQTAHIRVLAPDGTQMPADQPGELWIKTPFMIERYLNGPALGDDLLSPDGFFRTGDIGWVDEDGYLYITGRAKDMIIAGGVNIYPAEIEQALLEHPDVLDAAVIGLPEPEFGEQVAAFCEVRPGASLSAAALSHFVETRLAKFKRPRLVLFVDELPRNELGKILKDQLRHQYGIGPGAARTGPQPAGPVASA